MIVNLGFEKGVRGVNGNIILEYEELMLYNKKRLDFL